MRPSATAQPVPLPPLVGVGVGERPGHCPATSYGKKRYLKSLKALPKVSKSVT